MGTARTQSIPLPHWRRIAARLSFYALFLMLCLSGAVLSVVTLGRTAYRWHGLVVELRLMPAAHGQTALVLMPLGEVRAATHKAPVELIASLQQIEIEELRKTIGATPKTDALAQDFERTARADLRNFVARQMLFAALGALIAPTLLHCRRVRFFLLSGAIGMAIMGGTVGSALSTFDGKAFATPNYSGALKEAPWIIQFGSDAFTKIEALSTKLKTVANNLNVLYGRISAVTDMAHAGKDPDEIRVLHISDIHNNKAAIDFVHRVAEQFDVDFIVDTGDLTDLGSPPETVIVQQIGKLPIPYVFVAGNHDSRAVMDALAKLKNVTVLNGQVVEMNGLRLLGLPNPASARAGAGSVDTTPQEMDANAAQLQQVYDGLPEPQKPDILAVHDPQQSKRLWGRIPLVLCGHLHTPSIQRQDAPPVPMPPGMVMPVSTVLCNAGSTGAAGIRYFEGPKGAVPFTCAVLTFRRPAPDNKTASASPPAPAGKAPSAAPAAPAADKAPPPSPAAKNNTPLPALPTPDAHLTLRAIDMIILDGTLEQYSISHTMY